MSLMNMDLFNRGKEQKPDDGQLDDEKLVEKARDAIPFLRSLKKGSLGKYVKQRWDRMEKQARSIQNELRVNYLRYEGEPFAQVHPTNPNRLYIPSKASSRLPPTVNKILRTVHRYVAQTVADDPILEGAPAGHTDDERDAAEAATEALRAEWQRIGLRYKLRRCQETAAVMRSGFWFFEFDDEAGSKVPAQKFFPNEETGKQELCFVGTDGKRVNDASDARKIWEGNTTCEVLFPFNVRWSGARDLHDADEVMVGKVTTLRQLYESFPDARDAKVSSLLGHVTKDFEKWMHEIRGAGGIADRGERVDGHDEIDNTGHKLSDDSSLLDEKVMLLNYFKASGRQYPSGYHVMVAGKYVVYKGALRYGVIPVAQFRCLDSLGDPLGKGLVDILKDPQELMDFVNGQILRFLQSMKRRWFVPLTSDVNKRDLLNPTQSVIYYNAHSQPPTPEQTMDIPTTMPDMAERFDTEFDDAAGIHDTMKGKHVPGVSSGRHAEALRSGDETILGLTRDEAQKGLEQAGRIMLAMIQKEWSLERRVRFFDGRGYIERAFSSTDFGETSQVQLKKGTLLMLTQAQKLETLFTYFEMGALDREELRKLAPMHDVAGVSTTEDPHYQKARRENEVFLDGPPPKLKKARKAYEREIEATIEEVELATQAMAMGGDEEESQVVVQKMQQEAKAIESEWQALVTTIAPGVEPWEAVPEVASLHLREHAAALARERVERLPTWWVKWFTEQHYMKHLQVMQEAQQPEEQEGQQQAAQQQPVQGAA